MSIVNIFNCFLHKNHYQSHSTLIAGHINDTYLIKTAQLPYFVLQKINHHVFPNIPELIENKINASLFLKEKYKLEYPDYQRRVLTFIPIENGLYYYLDHEGNYWNLMVYIDQTQNFETVKNNQIAYEGGKLFGDFLDKTHDFDSKKLHIIIPQFHDMRFRLSQLDTAIQNGIQARIKDSKAIIEYIQERKKGILVLQDLLEKGHLPLKLTHNDTKISNVLFDMNDLGLCVIDLDTVMPGLIHYDFGDAIRTMCNTAKEDEKDISKISLSLDYFDAFVKGFSEKTKNHLTKLEIENLVLGAKYITFIQGVRIFTDYLNGDIYYKTDYPEHNLVRSRNQLQFLKLMDEKTVILDGCISKYF